MLGTQIEKCSVTLRLQSEFGFSIKLFCHGGGGGGVGGSNGGGAGGAAWVWASAHGLALQKNHLIGNLLQFAYFIAIKS